MIRCSAAATAVSSSSHSPLPSGSQRSLDFGCRRAHDGHVPCRFPRRVRAGRHQRSAAGAGMTVIAGADADFSPAAEADRGGFDEQRLRAFGLLPAEYGHIVARLGREPNRVELGMLGAMWSEHCGYKHSRKLLKLLPTTGPRVLQGPGENAGAVDIGDGLAVVLKMESHNHPSAVEPFQGAATGVGGILRDIFTMGARPVALLDSLRFGDPAEPRTEYLVGGVIGGIAHYSNCIGVPTVGGEISFDAGYTGNPIVNAMCVGLVPIERLTRAAASGPGNPLLLVGADTGRDGLQGAAFASNENPEASHRGVVQVGNPFLEKLLLEACLAVLETGDVLAMQDLGAAGLTSSAVEMAARGGLGGEIDVESVP